MIGKREALSVEGKKKRFPSKAAAAALVASTALTHVPAAQAGWFTNLSMETDKTATVSRSRTSYGMHQMGQGLQHVAYRTSDLLGSLVRILSGATQLVFMLNPIGGVGDIVRGTFQNGMALCSLPLGVMQSAWGASNILFDQALNHPRRTAALAAVAAAAYATAPLWGPSAFAYAKEGTAHLENIVYQGIVKLGGANQMIAKHLINTNNIPLKGLGYLFDGSGVVIKYMGENGIPLFNKVVPSALDITSKFLKYRNW